MQQTKHKTQVHAHDKKAALLTTENIANMVYQKLWYMLRDKYNGQ